jgi:cardiolipin synthase
LDERRIPSNDIPEGMDLEQWEAALDRMTNTRRTHGSLDFLVDGEAFFDRLTTRIAESQHTIKIRTYIFDNDDFALQIADLIKARSADVSVEILVDGLGTLVGGLAASTSVPEDFISPVSMKSYLQADSNVTLRMLGNTWLAGDHTKTYIFDDETAFLGGMNIGREYRYDWHDLMVELSGEVVDQLNYDLQKTSAESRYGDLGFLKRIKRRTSQPLEKGRAELRLLYTKPHDAQIYRAQLAAIRRSNRYIYVQNAYLSDDRILYELAKARLRGVDVRVIVPSRPDNPMMDRSNVLAINTLKRYGVRVYIYPGMTHVKAAIYDGWACFGTANFDKLSFKVNKEVNIGTSDPQIVAKLKRDVFEVDFARSREVSGAQETRIADYVYESIVDLAL